MMSFRQLFEEYTSGGGSMALKLPYKDCAAIGQPTIITSTFSFLGLKNASKDTDRNLPGDPIILNVHVFHSPYLLETCVLRTVKVP